MTYAYIQSVYPNFKTAPPIVNYNSYRNIKNVSENNSNLDNYSPFKSKLDNNIFKKDQINTVKIQEINNKNLQHYNQQIQPTILKSHDKHNIVETIETIDNTDNKDKKPNELDHTHDHNYYIEHVYKCNICKTNLNLELDKNNMNELFELLSYIVFGIFILILIDNSNK